MYNFFRYRFGDSQSVEDLTASTFEKAWRHRKKFHSELGQVSTWLFTIARNVATDHLRSARSEVPLDAHSTAGPERETEDRVELNRDVQRLGSLLRFLSDRERELISLKYGAGLTNRAIAEITDLSESNVGTILHRTVQRLRNAWEG